MSCVFEGSDAFTRLGASEITRSCCCGASGWEGHLAELLLEKPTCPFSIPSGSQFEEVYVGLGAKRIRETL
jgi:ATP-dependent Zn protease